MELKQELVFEKIKFLINVNFFSVYVIIRMNILLLVLWGTPISLPEFKPLLPKTMGRDDPDVDSFMEFSVVDSKDVV